MIDPFELLTNPFASLHESWVVPWRDDSRSNITLAGSLKFTIEGAQRAPSGRLQIGKVSSSSTAGEGLSIF